MTLRSKMLWASLVSVGLVLLMGLSLLRGLNEVQRSRRRLLATQETLDGYGRLSDDAWRFLHDAARARREGGDPGVVLARARERLEAEAGQLRRALAAEADVPGEDTARPGEREEVAAVLAEVGAWMARVASELRATPPGDALTRAEARLGEDFTTGPGRLLREARRAESGEREALERQWEAWRRRGWVLAVGVPAGALVLVVALVLATLGPLRRALRELQAGVERLGRGELDAVLPVRGHDELAGLAEAFNRMAAQLRDSVREKQRMVEDQAVAMEQELSRYNAMLEAEARARTAELRATNAKLAESVVRLQATQEQLRFADRLATVGQLAAGVGHEINNPLAYVLSNIGFVHDALLRTAVPSEAERQEWLEALSDAHEGAERVRLIARDLKMTSRPDDMSVGPVDVREVLERAAKVAGPEVRRRARLELEVGEVPPVLGNGPRLGQVFLNLLLNAAQALEPGRSAHNEVRVAVRAGAPGRVLVEVRDTGCGIPPEHLGRIFEPFFTTKPEGVGTGLGLSVCHGIIAALGGQISVESEVGRGTTFRVSLPAVQPEAEAPEREASRPSERDGAAAAPERVAKS